MQGKVYLSLVGSAQPLFTVDVYFETGNPIERTNDHFIADINGNIYSVEDIGSIVGGQYRMILRDEYNVLSSPGDGYGYIYLPTDNLELGNLPLTDAIQMLNAHLGSAYRDNLNVDPLKGAVDTKADSTSVVDYTSDISNLQSDLASKADSASIVDYTSDISNLQSDVASKADQSEVSTLTGTVNSKADQIDLDGKADQTSVDILSTEVGFKADSSSIIDILSDLDTKANSIDIDILAADTSSAMANVENNVTFIGNQVASVSSDASTAITLSLSNTTDITDIIDSSDQPFWPTNDADLQVDSTYINNYGQKFTRKCDLGIKFKIATTNRWDVIDYSIMYQQAGLTEPQSLVWATHSIPVKTLHTPGDDYAYATVPGLLLDTSYLMFISSQTKFNTQANYFGVGGSLVSPFTLNTGTESAVPDETAIQTIGAELSPYVGNDGDKFIKKSYSSVCFLKSDADAEDVAFVNIRSRLIGKAAHTSRVVEVDSLETDVRNNIDINGGGGEYYIARIDSLLPGSSYEYSCRYISYGNTKSNWSAWAPYDTIIDEVEPDPGDFEVMVCSAKPYVGKDGGPFSRKAMQAIAFNENELSNSNVAFINLRYRLKDSLLGGMKNISIDSLETVNAETLNNYGFTSNGGIYTDDFTEMDDWTEVSVIPANVFIDHTASANNIRIAGATAYRDDKQLTSNFSVTMAIRVDFVTGYGLISFCISGTKEANLYFYDQKVYADSGFTIEVGSDLIPNDQWIRDLTLNVNTEFEEYDVYLAGALIQSGVPCETVTSGVANRIKLDADDATWMLDDIKVGDYLTGDEPIWAVKSGCQVYLNFEEQDIGIKPWQTSIKNLGSCGDFETRDNAAIVEMGPNGQGLRAFSANDTTVNTSEVRGKSGSTVPQYELSQPFYFGFWIRWDLAGYSNTTHIAQLFQQQYGGAGGYKIMFDDDNFGNFTIIIQSGGYTDHLGGQSTYQKFTYNTFIPDGTWTFIAFTNEGTSAADYQNNVQIYMALESDDNVTNITASSSYEVTNGLITASGTGGSCNLLYTCKDGMRMDNLRVYNRHLPYGDVDTIFQSETGRGGLGYKVLYLDGLLQDRDYQYSTKYITYGMKESEWSGFVGNEFRTYNDAIVNMSRASELNFEISEDRSTVIGLSTFRMDLDFKTPGPGIAHKFEIQIARKVGAFWRKWSQFVNIEIDEAAELISAQVPLGFIPRKSNPGDDSGYRVNIRAWYLGKSGTPLQGVGTWGDPDIWTETGGGAGEDIPISLSGATTDDAIPPASSESAQGSEDSVEEGVTYAPRAALITETYTSGDDDGGGTLIINCYNKGAIWDPKFTVGDVLRIRKKGHATVYSSSEKLLVTASDSTSVTVDRGYKGSAWDSADIGDRLIKVGKQNARRGLMQTEEGKLSNRVFNDADGSETTTFEVGGKSPYVTLDGGDNNEGHKLKGMMQVIGNGILNVMEGGRMKFGRNTVEMYADENDILHIDGDVVISDILAVEVPIDSTSGDATGIDSTTDYIPVDILAVDTTNYLVNVLDISSEFGYKVEDTKVIGIQEPPINDLTGGASNIEIIDKINEILLAMRNHGLIED